MIPGRWNSLLLQQVTEPIDRLPRCRVHNGEPVMLSQRLHQQRVLLGIIARGKHVVREVRAIESGDDRARILERQLSADILTDFWCRCRGQRDRWWSTKLFS